MDSKPPNPPDPRDARQIVGQGGAMVDAAAFGLRIRSQFALPELARAPTDGCGAPDVIVRRGVVPPTLPEGTPLDPLMWVAPGDFVLDSPAGRYRVRGGREIIVDPARDATATQVRLYLLGTAMGALCHQRGLLPLHASVVASEQVAAAFAGASGAGKSTLAAHFQARGRAVLGDDLCAVETRGAAAPDVRFGIARLKLWPDAVAALGKTAASLERVGGPTEKYSLPVPMAASDASWPLAKIFVLGPATGGRPTITRLTGARAMSALMANIYRWPVAVAMGVAGAQFARCAVVARRCEVFAVRAAPGLADLPRLLDALDRHLARRGDAPCQIYRKVL